MNGQGGCQIKQALLIHYNINAAKIIGLDNGVQNENYIIVTSKQNYILRVYNFKNKEDIHYTIKVLMALQKTNFPSPRLVPTVDNEWYAFYQNKPCIVYYYIPGKNISRTSTNLLKQIGRLQGVMHTLLLKEYQHTGYAIWDFESMLRLINSHRDSLLKTEFPGILERVVFINGELLKMSFPDQLPEGGTHQDIKPENILISSDRISGIIDFDNGYYGDLIHDVTTTICWFCFRDNKLDTEYVKGFVSSYQKERRLSEIEKSYFSQSIKFRLLREAIIWPMYVSHNISIAKKYSDYFLTLYNNYDVSELELLDCIN
jgi:homoserine kinase type II